MKTQLIHQGITNENTNHKEYNLLSQIYNSTDEIEANVAFEFGLQNDLYYSLFHSYEETK